MPFTNQFWTLQNIITEFRGITGRPDSGMMSDQSVVNYINYYYQFVLPKELKIFWGYTFYQFYTQANIDQYVAPANIQTFNPAIYADGFPVLWYTDPDNFYSDYPQQENKAVVATGTGINIPFTFQIPAFPVLARSVYVTDGTQVAQDDGNGGFIAAPSGVTLTGTINYATGAVTGLVFPTAPLNNTNITCTSQTYMPNRPQGILFFPQQSLINFTQTTASVLPTPPAPQEINSINTVRMFTLRPVPDQCYLIKMQCLQIPNALVELTDVPFRPDLGPLIALGAALHVFKVFNQMDQYDQYVPEFMRFKDISMQDTYEELIYTRSVPTF